jgi:hypothetical protein
VGQIVGVQLGENEKMGNACFLSLSLSLFLINDIHSTHAYLCIYSVCCVLYFEAGSHYLPRLASNS